MANAPQLLNDDGTASMATALLMSHHGLRRDIARFAVALRGLVAGDQARLPALQAEWVSYRNTLHGHHEGEDQRIFPHMKMEHADLAPLIERLTADHRRIDPLLDRGDRAFERLRAMPEEAAAVVGDLSELLDPHLALEEAHVVPFLRDAKQFPPSANEAEAELFSQGFAWASDGVAPEVLAGLDAMLPADLVSRLPPARVAFAERALRVWGPTKPGASRTAIPDWLPGG